MDTAILRTRRNNTENFLPFCSGSFLFWGSRMGLTSHALSFKKDQPMHSGLLPSSSHFSFFSSFIRSHFILFHSHILQGTYIFYSSALIFYLYYITYSSQQRKSNQTPHLHNTTHTHTATTTPDKANQSTRPK